MDNERNLGYGGGKGCCPLPLRWGGRGRVVGEGGFSVVRRTRDPVGYGDSCGAKPGTGCLTKYIKTLPYNLAVSIS
jgi:hypothetical protein